MKAEKSGLMLAVGLLAMTGVEGAGAQGASENLFQNPGFESNQDWWGFDTTFGTATGTIAFDDPMAVHGGAKGAKIVVTAVDGENWHVQLQCPPQFEAVMNADYHLSFWGRTNSPDGKSVHAAIQDGAPDYTYRSGQDFLLDTTWRQFEVFWTSDKEGLEMLRFNLYVGGDTGTYYFDDFSLTATTPPVGLRNPRQANRTSIRKAAPSTEVAEVDVAGRSVRHGKTRGPSGRRFLLESGTR